MSVELSAMSATTPAARRCWRGWSRALHGHSL